MDRTSFNNFSDKSQFCDLPNSAENFCSLPNYLGKFDVAADDITRLNFKCKKVVINAAGNILVPIEINGVPLYAILDTAAQVTVVSNDFFKKYLSTVSFMCTVSLTGINGKALPAYVTEDILLRIGSHVFKWHVTVADIQDTCILGLDFISYFKLDIKLSENVLLIDSERIPLTLMSVATNTHLKFSVNVVALDRDINIPPRSGITVFVQLNDRHIADDKPLMLFQPVEYADIFILNIVFKSCVRVPVIMANKGKTSILLRTGSVVREVTGLEEGIECVTGMEVENEDDTGCHTCTRIADTSQIIVNMEVECDSDRVTGTVEFPDKATRGHSTCFSSGSELVDNSNSEFSLNSARDLASELVVTVRKFKISEFINSFPAKTSSQFQLICDSLPEHIRDLFTRSSFSISLHQSIHLAELMLEFCKLFLTGDTDLGHFKAVQHQLILHDDMPTKQHLRWTTFHFKNERESPLRKILNVGVIIQILALTLAVTFTVSSGRGSLLSDTAHSPFPAQTL
jgi:hypothetical protein